MRDKGPEITVLDEEGKFRAPLRQVEKELSRKLSNTGSGGGGGGKSILQTVRYLQTFLSDSSSLFSLLPFLCYSSR